MYTDHISRSTRTLFAVIVLAAWSLPLTAAASGEIIENTASVGADIALDKELGVLQGPIWQPVRFNPYEEQGIPMDRLIYRQQPAAAGQDFRTPAAVPVAERPGPDRDRPSPQQPDPSPSDKPDSPEPSPAPSSQPSQPAQPQQPQQPEVVCTFTTFPPICTPK